MFNTSSELAQLVLARADLSPANTRALNEIDGLLDKYPDQREVMRLMKAQAAGRAEKVEAA